MAGEIKTYEQEIAEAAKGLLGEGEQWWTTTQLQEVFTVHEFGFGHVLVTRKADNVRGTVTFNARPRFYYGWVAE